MKQTTDYLENVTLNLRKKTQDSLFPVDGNYGVKDATGRNKKRHKNLMCDAEKKTWNPRKENDWPVFGFSTNKLDHASESDHWHGKKTADDIVKSEIQITKHVIFCINCIYREKGA